MKFLVNIGLDVKATRTLAADVVIQILGANDFLVGKHKVVESDTEPTLVAEVTSLCGPMLTTQNFHAVAVDLFQDCIAVYRPATGGGALMGPGRAKWGAFNKAFFFDLEGKRLAPQQTPGLTSIAAEAASQ